MKPVLQPYNVVALTEDLPQYGLVRGQVGTIVEQYSPDAFEVEFVDNSGHDDLLIGKLPGIRHARHQRNAALIAVEQVNIALLWTVVQTRPSIRA